MCDFARDCICGFNADEPNLDCERCRLVAALATARKAARFCWTCSKLWERYRVLATEKWPWLADDDDAEPTLPDPGAEIAWAQFITSDNHPIITQLQEKLAAAEATSREWESAARAAIIERDQHVQTLIALNAEMERLRQQLAAFKKKTALDDAIQQAAGSLPEGWEITIDVGRDYGSVQLTDPWVEEVEFPSCRECLADEVNDAVAHAIATEAATTGAEPQGAGDD